MKHHDLFEVLEIIDYLLAKPCHETQISLQCKFGTGVYNIAYNRKYIGYDHKTATWVVLPAGYEYRDRLCKIMINYVNDHNLL